LAVLSLPRRRAPRFFPTFTIGTPAVAGIVVWVPSVRFEPKAADGRTPKTRLPQLDVLRAAAILLVLGRHMAPKHFQHLHSLEDIAPAWLRFGLETLQRGGWIGVDLFFVLSGFLVSGLLFQEHLKTGEMSPARFLIRRGFKIYPSYYVFLAAMVVVGLGHRHGPSLKKLIIAALFAQNYVPSAGVWYGLSGHCWSLCVEEHFYFLLPILLLVLHRVTGHFRAIPVIAVIVAGIALAFRIRIAHREFSFITHIAPTHLRIDSLLFGVVVSYWFHYYRDEFVAHCTRFRWLLIVAGLLLLSPAFIFEIGEVTFISTYGFALFWLGSGLLLSGMLMFRLPDPWPIRALRSIGEQSYSIYLWHWPILVLFVNHSGLRPSILIPCYAATSIAVGIGMARIIEMPALALRERLFPSATPGLHLSNPAVEHPDEAQPASAASQAVE
jgi:peptidoglycan/LPS O-acetylase OafA/YrhL